MKALVDAWYQKSPILYALAPLSWAYQLGACTKRWLYNAGLKKQRQTSTPVIVIGNITVGGTGKTPLVIALANILKQQGYQPGIVSRGYGGTPTSLPLHVTADTSPLEAGDETILIAQKTHCPVVVSPKRTLAVEALLNNYDCNVVLSDDGMQHYQMHRDIEIAVIDGQRRFGNGLCLPAGPLREPISRLNSVDFVVCQNGSPSYTQQTEYSMQLIADDIYQLSDNKNKLDITTAQKQPVHAIAGIGNPERFFKQLEQMGFNIIPHPFADHYNYQAQDICFDDDKLVIMTEKDAIKCVSFANPQHWCLPVRAKCDENFFANLVEKLKNTTTLKSMP
jgi:tetraacyldisaccharide 4'-kinase